jgi:hypothetical protein
MKKTVLLILLLSAMLHSYAQDVVILRNNGEKVNCTLTKIDSTTIYFTVNKGGNVIPSSLKKTEVQNMDQLMAKYLEQGNRKESQPKTTNSTKKEPKVTKPVRIGLFGDPLGFVEFGPMVGAELTIQSHLIIDAHVRFPSAGLSMYLINRNNEDGLPYKMSGVGIGGTIKYLIPSRIGGLYFGVLFEAASGINYYAQDKNWEWRKDNNYVVVAPRVGYKFIFSNVLFLNVGATFGAAFVTKDTWYYLNDYNGDSSVHDNGTTIKPFGMIDLGIGFEF